MSTLGERIVEAREGRGMTKGQLAEALGMSLSGLYLYEHDRRRPMEAVISTIARETGVNFRWLNSGQGEMYGEEEDIRSVEDERILRRLTKKDRGVLLRYLKLDTIDRRNIRTYLEQRITKIEQRKKEEG